MIRRQIVIQVVARHVAHAARELGRRQHLYSARVAGHGRWLAATDQRQAVHPAHKAIGKGLGVCQRPLSPGGLHGQQVAVGEFDQLALAVAVGHVLDGGVLHGGRSVAAG